KKLMFVITYHSLIRNCYKQIEEANKLGQDDVIKNVKKTKDHYIASAFQILTPQKQSVLLGMCKVLDLWCRDKQSRKVRAAEILEGIVMKDIPLELVHDIAQLKIPKGVLTEQRYDNVWPLTLYNSGQLNIFNSVIGNIIQKMEDNNWEDYIMTTEKKITTTSTSIKIDRTDPIWREPIFSIILNSGVVAETILVAVRGKMIDNPLSDYEAIDVEGMQKAFIRNLNCCDRRRVLKNCDVRSKVTRSMSLYPGASKMTLAEMLQNIDNGFDVSLL
ncbi:hypothetical protein EIN_086560, partial [Entamoeba invadens IP1]|uniref:hypothetical protein n=1 Tax=Entamoeba invadens IP1 TaxID=370355 RepID=UPI0002C3E2B7